MGGGGRGNKLDLPTYMVDVRCRTLSKYFDILPFFKYAGCGLKEKIIIIYVQRHFNFIVKRTYIQQRMSVQFFFLLLVTGVKVIVSSMQTHTLSVAFI